MAAAPTEDLSVAQLLARKPPAQREEILAAYDEEELAYDWEFWSRPSQYIDPQDLSWYLALYLAGRGA